MKKYLLGLAIGSLAALGLLFTSCDNKTGALGLDVIPPSDELFVKFDTSLVFRASTFVDDSIRSDESVFNAFKSYNLLGQITDPVFGNSQASFATEIRLAKNNVNLGTSPVVDSIVLHLKLAGHYGYIQSFHQIEVFKLKDSIEIDSGYFSSMDPHELMDPSGYLGTHSVWISPYDTALHIPLRPQDLTELSDTSNLVNSNSLKKAFFGFFLRTSASHSNRSVLYLDLLSTQSKLSLYYKNTEDTLVLDFPINEACARINLFRHDYQNPVKTAFADQLADTAITLPNIYVQGMAGVRGKISLPDMTNWAPVSQGQKIAITKAELIMTVNQRELESAGAFSINPFRIPANLQLAWVNTNGVLKIIPDQAISSSYFGGGYNSITQAYHFRITTMLQNLIDGEISDFAYFCLFPSDSRVSGNSVVLHGNQGADRIKLQVSYIEL